MSVAAEQDAILRIEPDPSEVFPLGRVSGAFRFLFFRDDLDVNGAPKIRRAISAREVLDASRKTAPRAMPPPL
ncbi:MAG: hypothetical protein HUU04_05035 [Verrucomicrobiae bacterium]|nr:hypothetical protein [Verrucomicrobiae bacterium]